MKIANIIILLMLFFAFGIMYAGTKLGSKGDGSQFLIPEMKMKINISKQNVIDSLINFCKNTRGIRKATIQSQYDQHPVENPWTRHNAVIKVADTQLMFIFPRNINADTSTIYDPTNGTLSAGAVIYTIEYQENMPMTEFNKNIYQFNQLANEYR